MGCLRRQRPPTLGTARHGPRSLGHKSGLSSQPGTAGSSPGCVLSASRAGTFSARGRWESRGANTPGMTAIVVDGLCGDCGHVPPGAGHSGRFIPQQGWPCCALCLAVPGRLSQGHIPVSWVTAAPLDVVLRKLPSGSMTKCSLKKSK